MFPPRVILYRRQLVPPVPLLLVVPVPATGVRLPPFKPRRPFQVGVVVAPKVVRVRKNGTNARLLVRLSLLRIVLPLRQKTRRKFKNNPKTKVPHLTPHQFLPVGLYPPYPLTKSPTETQPALHLPTYRHAFYRQMATNANALQNTKVRRNCFA